MKRTIVACLLLSGALLEFTACSSSSPQTTSDSTAQQQPAQPPPPPPPPKKQKDKRPIDERLTVGMSMDDVIAACGKPKGKSVNSDGTETWNYNNMQNAFIPYYSLSGGKFTFVTVQFDKDGKVKSWNTSEQSRY
jgi:Protein of unknown function (DUF2845)